MQLRDCVSSILTLLRAFFRTVRGWFSVLDVVEVVFRRLSVSECASEFERELEEEGLSMLMGKQQDMVSSSQRGKRAIQRLEMRLSRIRRKV